MRPLTRTASLLAAATALLLASVVLAAPASAHDALLGSDPAADSTVATLPESLTLTFSANLVDSPGGNQVQVTDATGASLNAGDATVTDNTISLPLTGSASGAVTVLWRAVSSDGHPISGSFAFTVAAPSPSSPTPTATPATTSAPTPTATTPVGTDDAAGTASTPLPWIILAVVGLAAIVVVIALVATRRRGSTAPDRDGSTPDSER